MDAFLSQGERQHIQRMYKKWLDNLRPDDFATQLYVQDLMKTRDKQKYDILQTPYKKNEFLFDVALQRITYDHLRKVRNLLVQTEQEDLARLLPVRRGDPYWEVYEQRQREKKRQAEEEEIAKRLEREHQMETMDSKSQQPQGRPTSPMETEPCHIQGTVPEQQLKSTNDQPHTAVTDTDVSIVPAARPENSDRPHGLPSYGIKENNQPRGRGYCLIIANYTRQLQGYERDIEKITHFYRDVLGYKVRAEKDINQAKMKAVLDATRDELNITANNYDRLFVFVLSHGTKEGIQTCLPDGQTDERIGGHKQYIKPEEIVSRFTHDNMPTLKDLPKVFFFQICRGVGLAQAAGDSGAGSSEGVSASGSMHSELAQSAAGADRIAIGADTLVCFASPMGYYSWVDKKKGSWLIDVAMGVFERHYQSEHLVDMITQVNKEITEKKQGALVDGREKEVYQIPCIKHNLTRKLFLGNN